MSGDISPPYAFMAWKGTTTFHLFVGRPAKRQLACQHRQKLVKPYKIGPTVVIRKRQLSKFV
jgi:putative heme iron utilization protein